MAISIILLNYKKPQLTVDCISSLYDQYKSDIDDGTVEILVVDNHSGDNSVPILKREIQQTYSQVKLIENSENAGFGKGCNLGAKQAKGDYLLFLNNDTVVKDRGLISMAEYMNNHTAVAILGGQLRNADGTLQASTGDFYTVSNVALLLLGMQRYGLLDKSPSRITEVDWVKGGLLMIRKDVFEKIGGFDEKIFMYIEDMELCFRAKKAGYSVFFYPEVTVLHKEHGSANKTFAIVNIYKNLLYFYTKHRSYGEYVVVKGMLIVKAILLIGVGFLLQKQYLRTTYSQALKGII